MAPTTTVTCLGTLITDALRTCNDSRVRLPLGTNLWIMCLPLRGRRVSPVLLSESGLPGWHIYQTRIVTTPDG